MNNYLVGTGMADVTGEAGNVGMMGYALIQQRTGGIHMRQWARAFVIAEPSPDGRRVVFVNLDLGMVFTSVHQEVMRRLAQRFGDRYTSANVMLSATHTHGGPGGYSHYRLYNITTGGFRPRTFEAIIDGIVTAIERADSDLGPGDIRLDTGRVHGANVNRALMAFERNPIVDKQQFPGGVDSSMTVLRFERNGTPIGVLSWFATHGTSMTNTNRLISPDNKGYAAYLWEHDWAGRSSLAKASGEPGFVAGFAQGNAGDMSPNVGAGDGYGPANNEFANTRIIGSRQAIRAREIFDSAQTLLDGPIDSRQRDLDFSQIEVSEEFRVGAATRTWPAIIGQAFSSGCFDGRGLPFIHQGDLKRHPMFKVLDHAIVQAPPEVIAGHHPKPVGLATGMCVPLPWTPQILPLQLLRIGHLVIVGGPGEFTITSGKRIREAVANDLGMADAHVVFAGYANGYSGYITTPEEYSAQLYEGGSTHFGPATSPAYQQEFASLAKALVTGEPTPSEVDRPDLSNSVRVFDPAARIPDAAGPGRRFGEVTQEPATRYSLASNAIVEATFVSANPSNDPRSGGTFLEVQRATEQDWTTVASDDDWETVFRWRRAVAGVSRANVWWQVPPDARVGAYRIVHHGQRRDAAGVLHPFSAVTRTFTLE